MLKNDTDSYSSLSATSKGDGITGENQVFSSDILLINARSLSIHVKTSGKSLRQSTAPRSEETIEDALLGLPIRCKKVSVHTA